MVRSYGDVLLGATMDPKLPVLAALVIIVVIVVSLGFRHFGVNNRIIARARSTSPIGRAAWGLAEFITGILEALPTAMARTQNPRFPDNSLDGKIEARRRREAKERERDQNR